MYQALYRKWRPQTFTDVCGQELITTALKNEIKNDRLSHAYLFTGCRGTGKTTCAKILAKAVNCEHPVDGDPCNQCATCRGIDDGSVLDVTEIDAASNNGVDSIRDLRDEVAFTPVVGKYRVYIIDEVHMLSAGAFNALLKTLEEPPAHVIFILATTEVHKLPATILSRCQRFDFNRISPEAIASRVSFVAAQEGLTITPDAAMLLARLADGALRDALSLLDQCASGNTTIDAAVVATATGMASREALYALTDCAARRDAAGALAAVDTLYRSSKDMERLCAEWISYVRNLMVLKSVPDGGDLIIAAPEEMAQMQALARSMELPAILHMMEVLQSALERLRGGVARRVEMEMAVLKLCDPSLDNTQAALLSRISELEKAVRSGDVGASAVQIDAGGQCPPLQEQPEVGATIGRPLEPAQPARADMESAPTSAMQSGVVGDDRAAIQQGAFSSDVCRATQMSRGDICPSEPIAANDIPPPSTPTPDEETPFAKWGEVLENLLTSCPPLYGVLAQSQAVLKGEMLLICTDNALFKELLAQDNNKTMLADAIRGVAGKAYRLGLRRTVTVQKSKEDPLSQLLTAARKADVPVSED